MLKKIEALRKKPKYVRDRFALTGAVSVTALIAVLWLVSLPAQFSEAPEVSFKNDTEGGFSRALSDIQGQFANALGGLTDSFDSLQEQSTTSLEVGVSTSSQYELDIDSMFTNTSLSKTSTSTNEPELQKNDVNPQNHRILIGTSSVSNKTN